MKLKLLENYWTTCPEQRVLSWDSLRTLLVSPHFQNSSRLQGVGARVRVQVSIKDLLHTYIHLNYVRVKLHLRAKKKKKKKELGLQKI